MYFGFLCCPFLKHEFRTTVFFFIHLVVTFLSFFSSNKGIIEVHGGKSCVVRPAVSRAQPLMGLLFTLHRWAGFAPLRSIQVESSDGFDESASGSGRRPRRGPRWVVEVGNPLYPDSCQLWHIWDCGPGWELLSSQDVLELCPLCWSSRPKRMVRNTSD